LVKILLHVITNNPVLNEMQLQEITNNLVLNKMQITEVNPASCGKQNATYGKLNLFR
jgi:hypothetical protein